MANTDPGVPNTAFATTTYNSNIGAMVARSNDAIVELLHCASANIPQMMSFDSTRASQQVAAMRSYINDYVLPAPLLDTPKTSQIPKQLDASPVVTECENQSINELIGQWVTFRDECANSQSARLPNNLMQFDTTRFLSYLDKMDAQLKFVATVEPLDMPQATPDEPMTGGGNKGV